MQNGMLTQYAGRFVFFYQYTDFLFLNFALFPSLVVYFAQVVNF